MEPQANLNSQKNLEKEQTWEAFMNLTKGAPETNEMRIFGGKAHVLVAF